MTTTTNGRLTVGTRAPARKPTARPTARRPGGKGTTARRLAWGVAGVAVSLMALSLSHCAESITTLTGMTGWQAWALGVGIDAGMVACEAAVIAGHRAGRSTLWATQYVAGAALLSAALNAYASVAHAPAGMGAVLAGILGAAIPAGVYWLGRVCGNLWE